MARKHVKVEPDRWYYWCDRLGLLVWQDMPSGDRSIGGNDPDILRDPESTKQYDLELKRIIDARCNHPCIVMWVPFNEGWGQFDTAKVAAWTKERDPSRLVDATSGWADRGVGDVYDMHKYPGPGMFPPEKERASVLGEFGGLGWPIEGHLWWDKRNWGYRRYKNQDDLRQSYQTLVTMLRPLIGEGLCAAVYTQTTGVEGEVNGLMTYDRAQVKMGEDWLSKVNNAVYGPPIKLTVQVPTSEAAPQVWRYTTEPPKTGWFEANFDDSGWKSAEAPFGAEGTPGVKTRTTWDSPDIWMRRTFEWTAPEHGAVMLRVHHDEDADIYINGKVVAHLQGYLTDYQLVPIGEKEAAAFRPGTNTIAVHCKNTTGGQCFDAGIVVVD